MATRRTWVCGPPRRFASITVSVQVCHERFAQPSSCSPWSPAVKVVL